MVVVGGDIVFGGWLWFMLVIGLCVCWLGVVDSVGLWFLRRLVCGV